MGLFSDMEKEAISSFLPPFVPYFLPFLCPSPSCSSFPYSPVTVSGGHWGFTLTPFSTDSGSETVGKRVCTKGRCCLLTGLIYIKKTQGSMGSTDQQAPPEFDPLHHINSSGSTALPSQCLGTAGRRTRSLRSSSAMW